MNALRIAIVAALAGPAVMASSCAPRDAAEDAEDTTVGGVRDEILEPPGTGPETNVDAQTDPPASEGIAAKDLILAQWRKAENRETCGPAGFAGSVEVGVPRAANFAGGWAVAWDRPGLRSAFGIAGTGHVPGDGAGPVAQRARLANQWPRFRELPDLPQPAFAGYGIEGAAEYPDDNPQGAGLNSLAYLRIGDQECDYNVWSRLGRAHLESLLASLRMIDL